MSQSGIKKGIAYYHCSNKTGCGRYCEQTNIEDQVAEKFKELQFSDEFINLVIEKAKRIFLDKRNKYEGRRQALVNTKTALEGKRKVAEDKLFENALTNEDFTRIRKDIAIQITEIDDEMMSLEDQREVNVDTAQEILLFTRDIYKAYKKASFNLKRQMLSFFWERFEIADGVILKSVSSPLFDELLKAEEAYFRTSEETPNPKNAAKHTDFEDGILTMPLLRG